jgi:PST family polysaccharide transporter
MVGHRYCSSGHIFLYQIIQRLFGNEYSPAAPVLTIYIWARVALFFGVASSQYLINENLTKLSFVRTFVGMILNVALNLIFIPLYGIIGSAVAIFLLLNILILHFIKNLLFSLE